MQRKHSADLFVADDGVVPPLATAAAAEAAETAVAAAVVQADAVLHPVSSHLPVPDGHLHLDIAAAVVAAEVKQDAGGEGERRVVVGQVETAAVVDPLLARGAPVDADAVAAVESAGATASFQAQ